MNVRDYILTEMSRESALEFLQGLDSDFPDNPTASDVKAWRRKFSFKHHPDVGGDPDTMKNVNDALDSLGGRGAPSRSSGRDDRPHWSTHQGDTHNGRPGSFNPSWETDSYSRRWHDDPPDPDSGIDWVKYKAWSISGKHVGGNTPYSYTVFDGNFSRDMVTVYGDNHPPHQAEIAELVADWGDSRCEAIVVQTPRKPGVVLVIPFRGGKPIPAEKWGDLVHENHNSNPFNDREFVSELKTFLDGV